MSYKFSGFANGAALVFNGTLTEEKYGNPGNGEYLTNIDCARDTSVEEILDCENVRFGSQCDNNNHLGFTGVLCRSKLT